MSPENSPRPPIGVFLVPRLGRVSTASPLSSSYCLIRFLRHESSTPPMGPINARRVAANRLGPQDLMIQWR